MRPLLHHASGAQNCLRAPWRELKISHMHELVTKRTQHGRYSMHRRPSRGTRPAPRDSCAKERCTGARQPSPAPALAAQISLPRLALSFSPALPAHSPEGSAAAGTTACAGPAALPPPLKAKPSEATHPPELVLPRGPQLRVGGQPSPGRRRLALLQAGARAGGGRLQAAWWGGSGQGRKWALCPGRMCWPALGRAGSQASCLARKAGKAPG